MSLANELAVVTGSSRGLGLAIAAALRAEGAHVVINYVQSQAAAEAAAKSLDAIAIRADVKEPAQVQALFDSAREHYGRSVSIVVNNAVEYKFNGDRRSKLQDISYDEFGSQFRTTIEGALNTTKAAISGFKQLGHGRIINIGTNLVQNPVVPYHDYTAAKGALLALTHTTAAELGPMNVTCNLVAGGLLRTTDASAATPEAVFEQIAAITPLRKVTSPEELAGAVVFFAGPLSRAVTGQQIVVDGGLCMT
ncbi:hypothetical protein AMS68_006183 [Peltaster fructicola]|uniref:3-oxoacyl-[acyl-carrier-protein] reductase n=1 Tax=Peltaster fructicola TaxID=286661 RepID=A0A6H0Y157_9PEZI|nr:hypothetical protein AMS68_006183 [Peltaster fructicola]